MTTKTHTPDLVNSLPCVLNCETQVRGFIFATMKTCTTCHKEKSISDFDRNKNNYDGRSYECKLCKKKRRRAPSGIITDIYSTQKCSSKKRNHPKPNYTKEELMEFAMSLPNFAEIYTEWASSGYDKMKKPSFDRIDDSKPYTLKNLKLVTWEENRTHQAMSMRNGLIKTTWPKKPVSQFTKSGKHIQDYISIMDAFRKTGVNFRCIWSVCEGIRKTSGGFKWKYKSLK